MGPLNYTSENFDRSFRRYLFDELLNQRGANPAWYMLNSPKCQTLSFIAMENYSIITRTLWGRL